MIEAIIASLFVAFISSLAWLAYKHPIGYRKIFPALYLIPTIIFWAMFIYDLGIMRAASFVSDIKDKSTITFKMINDNHITSGTVLIFFVAFSLYAIVLRYLPNILKDDDKDKPEQP